MIEAGKFYRKPFSVEAVQITAENMDEVAEWCGGEVIEAAKGTPRHVKITKSRPMSVRLTTGFVDDWVVYFERGYKVFLAKSFEASFIDEEVVKAVVEKEKELEMIKVLGILLKTMQTSA